MQAKEQVATQEEPTPPKKVVRREHPKAIEQAKREEPKVEELTISPPLTEMKEYAQADETAISQKLEKLEKPKKLEPNVAGLFPSQQPTTKEETAFFSSSPSECEYGFGYLSQREKDTAIPEICVTCPKSLDCMLSEYYRSEDAVKEIKKWYQL